jgi:hypothetical protein
MEANLIDFMKNKADKMKSLSNLPRKYAFLGGLYHHFVAKTTNTKNGRAKMHAKLLSQMAQQLTKLKGCTKHVEP